MEERSAIVTYLEDVEAYLLGSIADAQHIGTTPLQRCAVSTTIKDIKYGTLEMQGTPHQGCVIFFHFDIVGQRTTRRSQRIEELEIVWSLFPAAGSEKRPPATAATPDPAVTSPSLEIRHREPQHGTGKPNRQVLTTQANIGGQAGFQYASLNAGYGTSKSIDKQDAERFESHLINKRMVKFRLMENASLASGVPATFESALVMRTDCIPFSLDVSFTARMGSFLKKKATAQVLIAESLLRHADAANAKNLHPSLQKMESDEFLVWVRSQLQNDWLQAV